jgi:nucleotide-binding universal stress UspA family protein
VADAGTGRSRDAGPSADLSVAMRILLAVDGSAASDVAIDEVRRRPWPSPSTVRVLSVIQPYTPPATEIVLAGATLQDIRVRQATEADRVTRQAGERIAAPGLSVEAAVAEGDPRTMIVDAADEWNADLIVMGSHGRTGLPRLVLGSVAQSVVAHAHCSVEVVRRRTAPKA